METYTHPGAPGIVARNPFTVEGSLVRMGLTQGQVALVDLDDLPLVAPHRWCAQKFGSVFYVTTVIRPPDGVRRTERMHRLVCETTPQRPEVDHRNHDALDNRRVTLTACTRQENMRNRRSHRGSISKYKGVSWCNHTQKWRATICVDGKKRTLARSPCEVCTAKAYDAAARELFGEFAALNFLS